MHKTADCAQYTKEMRAFLRRHAHKILIGHGAAIALLTTSMMVGVPKAILYISPSPEEMRVGESATLSIKLNAMAPINAIGTTLSIPPEVDVVTISKESSFLDLWTEETVLREDVGELRFSGGSLRHGGLTGVHTALTLTVKAVEPGEAVFSFKDTEVHAHDGTGDLVSTELRTLSITIVEASDGVQGGTATPSAPDPQEMNADFDNSGGVTIADMSILLMKLLGPYDARFDISRDGTLSLADLSVFFSVMQKR